MVVSSVRSSKNSFGKMVLTSLTSQLFRRESHIFDCCDSIPDTRTVKYHANWLSKWRANPYLNCARYKTGHTMNLDFKNLLNNKKAVTAHRIVIFFFVTCNPLLYYQVYSFLMRTLTREHFWFKKQHANITILIKLNV